MSHLSPPPPEPPEPPSVYCTPSPQSKATTPSPLARIFMSRQPSMKPSPLSKLVLSRQNMTSTTTPHAFTPEFPYENVTAKTRDRFLLRRHHHTNPAIWCSAIICLIFSLLVIFFGIATLIIFLVVKPRTPVFDTSHASLNVIYFDSPGHFNGDFTFIANFSNPNKKLDVRFEYAVTELYFENDLIATQSIRPFSQRRKETGVVTIHFISSLVYWLHGRCELQMSSPPSGFLMARTWVLVCLMISFNTLMKFSDINELHLKWSKQFLVSRPHFTIYNTDFVWCLCHSVTDLPVENK